MHSYNISDLGMRWKVARLNPCFNGRCTRTMCLSRRACYCRRVLILVLMEDALVLVGGRLPEGCTELVLILVLMEDALVLQCCRQRTGCKKIVLILVLMEDALVHYLLSNFQIKEVSLNPCFNGRCTRTFLIPESLV